MAATGVFHLRSKNCNCLPNLYIDDEEEEDELEEDEEDVENFKYAGDDDGESGLGGRSIANKVMFWLGYQSD